MMFQDNLDKATLNFNTKLETSVIRLLQERRLTLTICDGFTNGLLPYILSYRTPLTPVIDTYVLCHTTQSKLKWAGVSPKTIQLYGENSPETALEMAQSAQLKSQTSLSIGITGQFIKEDIAISGQFNALLCAGLKSPSKTLSKKWILNGTTHSIIKQAVSTILMTLNQLIEHYE